MDPTRSALVLVALAAGACTEIKEDTSSSSTTSTNPSTLVTGSTLITTPDPTLPTTPPTVPLVTDAFQITVTDLVDVLWVVDNSCSMAEDQSALAGSFSSFLDHFLGTELDYHIGVTSTDLDGSYNGSKGHLVDVAGAIYIDAATVDPVDVFARMSSLGTTGSALERGLGAAYLALDQEVKAANAGFYRDDATLQVIIVSDEPDYSTAVITAPDFVAWFDLLKPDPAQSTFSGLCDPNLSGDYLGVAAQLGGLQLDVADDWQTSMDALGALAAAGAVPQTVFPLSALPDVATLAVSVQAVDGTVELLKVDVDWTYDEVANSVALVDYLPESLSTVLVTYSPR
jgi:hypothetical protein